MHKLDSVASEVSVGSYSTRVTFRNITSMQISDGSGDNLGQRSSGVEVVSDGLRNLKVESGSLVVVNAYTVNSGRGVGVPVNIFRSTARLVVVIQKSSRRRGGNDPADGISIRISDVEITISRNLPGNGEEESSSSDAKSGDASSGTSASRSAFIETLSGSEVVTAEARVTCKSVGTASGASGGASNGSAIAVGIDGTRGTADNGNIVTVTISISVIARLKTFVVIDIDINVVSLAITIAGDIRSPSVIDKAGRNSDSDGRN